MIIVDVDPPAITCPSAITVTDFDEAGGSCATDPRIPDCDEPPASTLN